MPIAARAQSVKGMKEGLSRARCPHGLASDMCDRRTDLGVRFVPEILLTIRVVLLAAMLTSRLQRREPPRHPFGAAPIGLAARFSRTTLRERDGVHHEHGISS